MRMATMEARHRSARWFRRTVVTVERVEIPVAPVVAATVVAEEVVAVRIICIASPMALRVVEVMEATVEMVRPKLHLLKTEVTGLKQPEERVRAEAKELVKAQVVAVVEVTEAMAETAVTTPPLAAVVVAAVVAMAHLETVETEALR